jgi:ferredoxin-type protein NapG
VSSGEGKNRREFLIGIARRAGIAAAGGLVWAGILERGKAYPTVLRPPGAVGEQRFLAACTKCGLCVAACPYRALILARPGDDRPLGTPYFSMRENPCRMCRDIPCAAACPTGALDTGLVSDPGESGRRPLNINKARIGLAVIDRETCIAYWGIQCDACYRSCPVIDKAITVEYARNDRTGKHAILGPVVHSDECTGCGMCERACVTKKASIFVLPRRLALGESSDRYVRGWEAEDEQRLRDAPEETTTKTPRSDKSPTDYLNREDL